MIRDIVISKKHRTDLPTDYSELTMRQYFELELWKNRNGNYVEVLPILTDIPIEIWDKAENGYEALKYIILPNIQSLLKPVKWRKIRMLDKITILGKEIEVPKNLELETLGQKVQLDIRFSEYLKLFENQTKSGFHQMAYILAVYLSPRISGKEFDIEFTDEVRDAIIELPALDIIPIGTFFLKNWNASIRRSVLYLLRNAITQRFWQIKKLLVRSLKNLDGSALGTRSQEEM